MASKKHPIISNQPTAINRIDAGSNIPTSRSIPKPNEKAKPTKWSFGFQFFSQTKYFEIGGVDNGWYISLLTRLKEVSQLDRDKFLSNFSQHGNIRYHEINWDSRNIPIKRQDLNWIHKDYLDNEEEYPMLQFHISQALGRIVGFWDENNIFQVVLLDPLHNIQPSKRNNYHVDDTYYMSSKYSSLLIDIQKIQNKIKIGSACNICFEIKKLPSESNNTNFVFGYLEDEYIQKLDSATLSLKELIELGLLSC